MEMILWKMEDSFIEYHDYGFLFHERFFYGERLNLPLKPLYASLISESVLYLDPEILSWFRCW